jgi:hypothetical protein
VVDDRLTSAGFGMWADGLRECLVQSNKQYKIFLIVSDYKILKRQHSVIKSKLRKKEQELVKLRKYKYDTSIEKYKTSLVKSTRKFIHRASIDNHC